MGEKPTLEKLLREWAEFEPERCEYVLGSPAGSAIFNLIDHGGTLNARSMVIFGYQMIESAVRAAIEARGWSRTEARYHTKAEPYQAAVWAPTGRDYLGSGDSDAFALLSAYLQAARAEQAPLDSAKETKDCRCQYEMRPGGWWCPVHGTCFLPHLPEACNLSEPASYMPTATAEGIFADHRETLDGHLRRIEVAEDRIREHDRRMKDLERAAETLHNLLWGDDGVSERGVLVDLEQRLRAHENPPDTALIKRVERLEKAVYPTMDSAEAPKRKRHWYREPAGGWHTSHLSTMHHLHTCPDCGSEIREVGPAYGVCDCEE